MHREVGSNTMGPLPFSYMRNFVRTYYLLLVVAWNSVIVILEVGPNLGLLHNKGAIHYLFVVGWVDRDPTRERICDAVENI